MAHTELKSFKLKDFKCFLNENDYQGFEDLKPINLIIGKNNSGKSKILEFLQIYVKKNQDTPVLKDREKVQILKQLNNVEVRSAFQPNARTGPLNVFRANANEGDWAAIGTKLVDGLVYVDSKKTELIEHQIEVIRPPQIEAFPSIEKMLDAHISNPIHGYIYQSIQAERDIKPEGVNFNQGENFIIQPDGSNLTQLLVRCLFAETGHQSGWQELIEKELLSKLNQVLEPDLCFTRIFAKATTGGAWELYLEEEHKGGIKISDCGSGIKTVLHVMTLLYVAPKLLKKNKIIYSFEELENNLHPSLERKLLSHIRDKIANDSENLLLFLTTHSNVALDMFSTDQNAQIYRAHNNGKGSYIEKVSTWSHHSNLLDELGVKASDLLQSNCIVWVEGPSDRIYLKKWIQLFNDGAPIEEGLHYQCVFHSGSLLAHYSASAEETDPLIKMLKVNRNMVVLMDSDRRSSSARLKGRVKRVVSEINGLDRALSWVTKGREIENYIPNNVLSEFFSKPTSLDEFDSVAEKFKEAKGIDTFDKVKFASEIIDIPSFTRESLSKHLDLENKVTEVITYIRECNS